MLQLKISGQRTKTLESLAGVLNQELAHRRKRHEKRKLRKLAREMHDVRRKYMLASNTAVAEYVGVLRSMGDIELIGCERTELEEKFQKCLNACKYCEAEDVEAFWRDVLRERFIVVAEIRRRTGKSETAIRTVLKRRNLKPLFRVPGCSSGDDGRLVAPGERSVRIWSEYFYSRSATEALFRI